MMTRPAPGGEQIWRRPADLAAALESLAQSGEGDAAPGHPPQILAGGTDFYASRVGQALPPAVLDISAIRALRGISSDRMADGRPAWRIGATTTWTDLVRGVTPALFHALVQAAREVGGVQVQNRGTVGGNLCNASPAADGAPPLLVMGAEVELGCRSGTRRLPLTEFLQGVRRTARRADELLLAVYVPQLSGRVWTRFLKLGHRRYLVISIVMVAVLLDFDDNDRVSQCAIAVGACAPTARRLPGLEQQLLGVQRRQMAARAASWLRDHDLSALSPIDDVRGSAAYRLQMARVAIERLLAEAVDPSAGNTR